LADETFFFACTLKQQDTKANEGGTYLRNLKLSNPTIATIIIIIVILGLALLALVKREMVVFVLRKQKEEKHVI